LGIRGLSELTNFFDKGVIDGIINGVGLAGFCIGEEIKSVGGGENIVLSILFLMLCILVLILFSMKMDYSMNSSKRGSSKCKI
jgi:NAD(P)H-quinone oxidoreductase subunit 5